jgi:D-alanyl-lipoteichoic acid acyltransferase DltB (MBOAT superfamily)
MVINIILILLPLLFYKYFTVINNGIVTLLESNNLRWHLPEIKLLLPIGISFYTFMAIGYTVDVFNEKIEVEKNPGIVALFVSFFPLILSGPIERAGNMIPQFRNQTPINYDNISDGFKIMLWGYFMKLVVADRIGIYVDTVYNDIAHQNGTTLLIVSVLYPFQVYADLGGYSLIAIGIAKTFGFDVMHNFRRPFFASSMSEFWRRWHISLISWLTDYIYTPLSFILRKYKVWGLVIALMLTFIISGIWHGAALTFIVWGLLQGLFLSIEALTKRHRLVFEKKYNLKGKWIYNFTGILLTFILFAGSLIFARAAGINEALLVIRKIFTSAGIPYLDLTTLTYVFSGLLLVFLKDFRDEFYPDKLVLMNNQSFLIRSLSYLAILFLIILFGVYGTNQFIYFQF